MDGALHSTKLVQKDVLDFSFSVWSHNVLQYSYCSLMMPEKREYFTPLFIHLQLHCKICTVRTCTEVEYYHFSDSGCVLLKNASDRISHIMLKVGNSSETMIDSIRYGQTENCH